jgi:predicted DsbA family dithiol-disulfide isomerase
MVTRLRRIAADLELPFGNRSMTYNSRLAQELGMWVRTQNQGDRYHVAVFETYFGRGRNIAQIEVLLEIVESLGLSRDQARRVLETRRYRKAVDSDWQRSKHLGIAAVPTLMIRGSKLVGAQPYEIMEKFLINHRIPRRSADR